MGAHGISVANASMMRSAVIVAVFAFALAVTAQEDTEAVVPEMDELATGSALAQAGKTTVQTHYETEEVPQKEVVEKPVYENVTVPVEEVHYQEVTKTIPVQKKVEVKEVVETTHTGCDLVVESCFATPGEEEVPAWKAPVIKYQHSYSNLCATESAAKRAAELKEKAAEKKTKEAASKGIEKNKKAEIVAKESSRKSAEKEEKLFKSEKDSKESASKAISMAKTHEKIVYVPSAAPIISASVPTPAPNCANHPEMPECLPKPSPAPAPVTPPKKYVCDSKKCQCVESTNDQGDDFNYCTEMCQMENFYKSRARPYPVTPIYEQPETRPLERGIKRVRLMKERFGKAKIEGVNAIKEAWSKHGVVKKGNHCKETHEICGKIHSASVERQSQAADAASAHTASLETNCAKTVAFAKEAAEELTYHVCAAAAAKMDGLVKTIQNDFEYVNVTIPTISWGATFASAYGGEAATEQQQMQKEMIESKP